MTADLPATAALSAAGFPAEPVRARARLGAAAAFPPAEEYGSALFGAGSTAAAAAQTAPATAGRPDALDAVRLVPPVFMPQRLEKLIELGREPLYQDVELQTAIGRFRSPLPLFVSALGSTRVASVGVGAAISRQAGRLGIPMVIGENIVPSQGYGRIADAEDDAGSGSLLQRIQAYADRLPDGFGGVVVQQSTEDADAEVWNLVYSDPGALALLESGRLAFELKVGQGAKPGLGGMTVLDAEAARRMADRFAVDPLFGGEAGLPGGGTALRCASPGTFTAEILKQQIRLMRNNFPRAGVWVKLHPGRDIREAAEAAWAAGADAVTVDGAEGGTGWAPTAFLDHVGLPLGECLRRIGRRGHCLLATGRMWDGARAVKTLALGARAVGLGRAAVLAADEDAEHGLLRLAECLATEIRMLISALGKYDPAALGAEDLWPAPPHDEDAEPLRERLYAQPQPA